MNPRRLSLAEVSGFHLRAPEGGQAGEQRRMDPGGLRREPAWNCKASRGQGRQGGELEPRHRVQFKKS